MPRARFRDRLNRIVSAMNHRFGGRARSPWLAFFGLVVLFELPTIFVPDGIDLGLLRPTGELFVLLTVCGASFRLPSGKIIRWLLAVVGAALVVVRVDRAIFFVLTRSEPLLYDQLFLVRHFFVLLSDLANLSFALWLAVFGAALAATVVAIRALVRRTRPLFLPPRLSSTAKALAGFGVGLAVLTALEPKTARPPWVRWMTPEISKNIALSRRVYRTVETTLSDSPYRAYDGILLGRKPDVFFFFVESYGKLIAEDPAMREIWVDELGAEQARLESGGWHSVSGYCSAPVSGGRSWLATASIWMGMAVKYEAVYRQLVEGIDRLPTFVRFMQHQGYETIHLAPSDRARPGMGEENPFGWHTYVAFDQLGYRGPRMGWGIVPDQYALAFTDEHYLAGARHPLFFNFHMVSSHAAWATIPEYVSDWHTLNDAKAEPETYRNGEIAARLERYSRMEPHQTYMGELTAKLREGYERSIFYDLRVIEDFLSHREGDALVIVMGDHQPPVVAPEATSFDVPVHVLSRDPKLLEEFRDRGFSDGLVLGAQDRAVIEHAGLFSVLVRALARVGGAANVPPYLPHGVPL